MATVSSPMTQPCEYCRAEGKLPEMVHWSDGWGITSKVCPLCHGTKETETQSALLQRLVDAENHLAATQAQLDQTRTVIALYFLQQKGEINAAAPVDNPSGTGLKLAPWPALYGWEEKLAQEAAKAPRKP